MTESNTPSKPARPNYHSSRSMLLLSGLGIALILVPFLFWQGTWFGRRLTPDEIDQYVRDEEHPRKIQHALSQIVGEMTEGKQEALRWYPQIIALAGHPTTQVRLTAAWAMGQDATSDAFHNSLLQLLKDPELMVRRNAALSLVRFGDSRGRQELIRMLQPHTVRAPVAGSVSVKIKPDQDIVTATLLATIAAGGSVTEVRAPFSCKLMAITAKEGARVESGDSIALLSPGDDQVWEALRGLYLIGAPEDLPLIEAYQAAEDESAPRIRRQAVLTARSIRTRAERPSIH